MMREYSLASIRAAAALSCLLFALCSAQAQSVNGIGPAAGQIVLIRPAEPKGGLKVVQAKGVDPVNATEKMLVRRGNLLNLDPKATAIVLCGDGAQRKLVPGLQPCPCTTPCTPEICGINYDGGKLRPTRGGADTDKSNYPVVISPRATLLLTTRPAIRWTPIAGPRESTTYKVTIYGENMKVIWSRNADSKTRLAYPDEEPALAEGQTYKVVVTAAGLSSESERSPGLGFTTLTQDQALALGGEETKRRQLGLPDAQSRFLISTLYAARELYSEAIDRLEDQYNANREAAVARALGDLYAAVGLNREAEKKYLEGLDITPKNDLDGQGLAQRALARVYGNLGMFDQAVKRLEAAIENYRRLKDRVTVNVLLDEERKLKKH